METSETVLPKNPAEMLPVENLKIRPITVIQNTLNSLKAIHNLQRSPLLNLVMNPLAKENLTHHAEENFAFKCYVSKLPLIAVRMNYTSIFLIG